MKTKLLLSFVIVLLLVGTANALTTDYLLNSINGSFNLNNPNGNLTFFRLVADLGTPPPKFNESMFFNASNTGAQSYSISHDANPVFGWTDRNTTWEFWLMSNRSLIIPSSIRGLFGIGANRMLLRNVVEGGHNNLSLAVLAGSNNTAKTWNGTLNDTAWHHIAITAYNATITGKTKRYIRWFIDGTEIVTFENFDDDWSGAQALTIGARSTPDLYSIIGFDELRISNSSRYFADFTPPVSAFTQDSNTLVLYHFNPITLDLIINQAFLNKTSVSNSSINQMWVKLQDASAGTATIQNTINLTFFNKTLTLRSDSNFTTTLDFPVGNYNITKIFGTSTARQNSTKIAGLTWEVVPPTIIEQCNAGATDKHIAINFTFYDEINQTKFDKITKFIATFVIKDKNNASAGTQNITITVNDAEFVGICIQPALHTFEVNATIKYEKAGFNFRNWHFFNKEFKANTINESLFLLQASKATADVILVTDSLDTPLEDIIIEVDKFFISNNTHRVIGMIKSGLDGKDFIYLQNNEADYRFRVIRKGVVVKLTTLQKLTASAYTIKILSTTLTDLIANVNALNTNLTYDNHSKYFSYGFSDPGNNIAGACLQTSIRNFTGTYFQPLNCTFGSFVGILRANPGNYTTQTAVGYGYVILNGSTLNFGKQTLEAVQGLNTHISVWGKYGIYLLMMLVIGTVMIFVGNPVGIIIALMISLFIAWWMDIFTISTIAMTGIMIGLGVLIKELRS